MEVILDIIFYGLIILILILLVIGLIGYGLMFLPSILGIWLALKLEAGWISWLIAGAGIVLNLILFIAFSDFVSGGGSGIHYPEEHTVEMDRNDDDDWLAAFTLFHWIDHHRDDES